MKSKLIWFTALCLVTAATVSANVVNTEAVHYQDFAKKVKVSGKLANKAEQKLSFKIQGIVATIHVDEGQRVTTGQLLATLDQAEIQAQVKQANSVFENSETNLSRIRSLFNNKVITQEQLQAAQTQFDVARSDLQIALFNQKHAEIRATSSGLILKRLIEKNELVNTNQPAFVISNEQMGWVLRVGVTDREIVRLEQGNIAVLTLDAYPGQVLQGEVSEIAAAADEHTGLFEIEIRLQQQNLKLYSGFVAQAEVKTNQSQRLAFLPVEAIVSANGKKAKVFVVDNQHHAQMRQIKLAFIQENKIAVSKGLNEGESIVTNGAAYLRNGMSVEIVGNMLLSQ